MTGAPPDENAGSVSSEKVASQASGLRPLLSFDASHIKLSALVVALTPAQFVPAGYAVEDGLD